MNTVVFTIGRERSAADIIPHGEGIGSVSRCHARVRADLEQRSFRIEDLGSTNGLFVLQGNGWQKITKGILDADVPVRFGHLETTFAALLPQIQALAANREYAVRAATPPQGSRSSHPRRNPATGEIID